MTPQPHATEAAALATRLRRTFLSRAPTQIVEHVRSELDGLGQRRFESTCWQDVPDWVVTQHVDTLARLTDEGFAALAPAFLRCLLLNWHADSPILSPLLAALCDERRVDDDGAVAFLLPRERRFICDVLTLVARTPDMEDHREDAVRGLATWRALRQGRPRRVVETLRPDPGLRRRDFTPIASGIPVAEIVEDLALDRASLRLVDLAGQRLARRHLPGVDLRSADLRGADLRGAVLEGADLTDALLEGADLRGARLTHASLSGSTLFGTRLDGVYAPMCCFDGAYIEKASFDRATLDAASFQNVTMRRTSMRDASAINALLDPDEASELDVTGTDLCGSSLLSRKSKSGDSTPTPPLRPPVTRGPLFDLIGRPAWWIREVSRVATVSRGDATKHQVHRIELRPDYQVEFSVAPSNRICGIAVEHPANINDSTLLRWTGRGDDASRRRYVLSSSPVRLSIHRRTCELR